MESDKKNAQEKPVLISGTIKQYLGVNGFFSKKVKGFTYREGQVQMASLWESAQKEGESLVCEAGTGTGKTFAYLIPSILSGKTLVISTASKALQDQLVNKDLPAICELLNVQKNYMALKGFSNYLCLKKYNEICDLYVSKHGLNFNDSEISAKKAINDDPNFSDNDKLDAGSKQLHALDVIVEKDLAKIQLLIEQTENDIASAAPNVDFVEINSKFPQKIANFLTCSSEHCLKKKCKYYPECYPYRARDAAIHSKIVVINHALYFSTLQFENIFNPMAPCFMLPKYRSIIFDEAHELPSVGREHFSRTVGSIDLKKFQLDIEFIKKNMPTIPIGPFEDEFKLLKKAYLSVMHYLKKAEGNGENKRNFLFYKYEDYQDDIDDPYFEFKKVNAEFRNVVGELYRALKRTAKFFNDMSSFDEDFFSSRVDYYKDKFMNVVDLMNLDKKAGNPLYGKYVGIVTLTKKHFLFSLTPLEISEYFGNYLNNCFSNRLSVLLTSATLSVDHKFTKYLIDIGASNDTQCMEVPSSFDYRKQSCIYYSENFPSFNDETRIHKIVETLKPVIEKVNGGVFFLTTSYTALNQATVSLSKYFHGKRKVYSQSGNMSNMEMLMRFKKDGNAILIGTSSFWAGVDVQGKALSMVIIDKLPFESPSDPIFKERCRYYDAKNNKRSFVGISIPEAVIELRQGAGRLIRHEDDRGALIICDPRIKKMNYGSIFRRSLPDMHECNSLDEVIAFLEQ